MDLEQEYEHLLQQFYALQQMLAHAVDAAGGEVRINKEDLVNAKFAGTTVDLSEDNKADQFVIRLVDTK